MLSCAEAALVDRDPAVAGLPLLLDEAALAERLGAPVRRRYLRYKAGTACVLALDVAGERCFAIAHAAHAAPKLDKTLLGAPEGSVLAVDRDLGLLVARPSADRDLPALARMAADLPRALRTALRGTATHGTGLEGAALRPLSHKPQRRWVGRLDVPDAAPVVLRVSRPRQAHATARAVRVLDGHAAWTPRLLGADPRLGVVAVSWLPGTGLDALLATGAARPEHVRAAGAALAELHDGPRDGLEVRTADHDVADVRRAARAVGRLLPELAPAAAALALRLGDLLREDAPEPVAAHGDLSADQVVVTGDGRTGLVDLDSATAAEPALDLGSAVAALAAAAVLGTGPQDVEGPRTALLEGYAREVDPHRLQVHISAALLRRAVEPFRLCRPGWAAQVAELLALAERSCPLPVRA